MASKARASFPRFRREGGERAIELTDDDLAVLRHVHRHRFIRASDLHRLFHYRSKDKLSRRLTWLFRGGYLDRPIAQIDRYGEGGSRSMVYGLGGLGARTLKDEGLPIGPTDWGARNRSYTRQNLEHTLAVTSFMVALEIACRARDDVELIPFDEILTNAPDATRRSAYPSRWPVPVQWSLARADVWIIPDAIFGLRVMSPAGVARRTYVFLEMDRGTMTIAPADRAGKGEAFLYRSTILRKFLAYAESHRLMLQKERFGISAARVVFLTTSAARADTMRKVVQSFLIQPMLAPAGLFLFGALPDAEQPLDAELVDAVGHETALV